MLVAEIIQPNKVKEWHERGYIGHADEIACDECLIDYSVKDYHTLMEAKKIAYFFLNTCDTLINILLTGVVLIILIFPI